MATANERLLQWLRDARAIEKQAERMLRTLAQHIENYPAVKAHAEQIIRETGEQAAALQDYVDRRAEDARIVNENVDSATKEGCLSGAFVGPKSVKRAMTEISGYNILLSAAEAAGDSETRAVCEAIRRQEEAMMEWLRKFVGSATIEHIGRRRIATKDAKDRPVAKRKNGVRSEAARR